MSFSSMPCSAIFFFLSVDFVFAGNEGQGSWVAISTEKGCQQNGEGIEPVGTRGFIPDLKSCRSACLLHGKCIAVDFFAETGVCQLYDSSCLTPGASGHGASSYHMPRSAEFKAIDDSGACEENDEGVVPIEGAQRQAVASLQHCQGECLRRGNCRAVDFYRRTGYCIFYSVPCTTPKSRHDGACSYRIIKQLEERTIVDVKRDYLTEAKLKKSFGMVVTDQAKSCESNHEGISPIEGKSHNVESEQQCKEECAAHDSCAAIDYFRDTMYCVFYNEACMYPLATHSNPISSRFKLADPKWETINSNKACESNKEGVERMGENDEGGRLENSLASCKQSCWYRLDCMAIDYYRESKWCNFYFEACSTPLSTAAGASSFRLVRSPGTKSNKPLVRSAGSTEQTAYGLTINKATSVMLSDMGQRIREGEM